MNIWRKFLAFVTAFALSTSAMAGGTGPTVFEPFMWVNNGTLAAPSYSFIGDTDAGMFYSAFDTVSISSNTVARAVFNNLGVQVGSNTGFNWDSVTNPDGSGSDLSLFRDAANTLAQRNGTNAQALRVYNTYTDASNYERLGIRWATNIVTIGPEGAGTGSSARTMLLNTAGDIGVGTLAGSGSIFFSTNNTNRWQINNSGHLIAFADNTYDIGASGANRPRNIYAANSIISGGVIGTATGGSFYWDTRSIMTSPTDGTIRLTNFAASDFNRLQFGGSTSSFPAIKRDSAGLQARLADDSANADFDARTVETDGFTVATLPTCNAGAAGTRAYVTDATAPAFLTALVGGGAVVSPAFCNGTTWVAG